MREQETEQPLKLKELETILILSGLRRELYENEKPYDEILLEAATRICTMFESAIDQSTQALEEMERLKNKIINQGCSAQEAEEYYYAVSQESERIKSQLTASEARCKELEEQLEHGIDKDINESLMVSVIGKSESGFYTQIYIDQKWFKEKSGFEHVGHLLHEISTDDELKERLQTLLSGTKQ